jgi:hypothetical protein
MNVSKGQTYPLDSVNYSKVKYFMIVDTLKVEVQQKDAKQKNFIFINNNPIDSTGLACDDIPVWHNNCLFFNTTSKDFSKKLMYTQNGLKKHQSIFKVDNGFQQYYDYDYTNVYIIDPFSGNKKSHTNYKEMKDCAVSGFFIDSSLACIIHCCEGIESCDYTRYYLVSSIETKEITQQIRQALKEEDAMLTSLFLNFISTDKQYLHIGVQYMSKKYSVRRETVSRIFNQEFKAIGKVLDLNYPTVHGVNIQKNEIQNYFLGSMTDTKDSTKRVGGDYANKFVIIPYVFNPTLELAMYKAYSNSLLKKEDVKGLGKYELGILRNVIFAKYNYAFTSEFYQAYFNLYEFYGDWQQQKSREKDVSQLLTEIDKANVAFVREVEAEN